MAKIMIKCPETGKFVPVGIEINRSSFDVSQFEDNRVMCPHCRAAHTWGKKDVHLIEELGSRGSSASG